MAEPILPYGRQTVDDEDIEPSSALASDFLTTGPEVAAFEADLADSDRCAARAVLNSGTSALHATYFAVGLGAGDEIVMSPLTFAATANAALYLGADRSSSTSILRPASSTRPGRRRHHAPARAPSWRSTTRAARRLRRARTIAERAHRDRCRCRALARRHRRGPTGRHARRRHDPVVPPGQADHHRRGWGGPDRRPRSSCACHGVSFARHGRATVPAHTATTGRGTRRCSVSASTTG